jgi:hypothetical protein
MSTVEGAKMTTTLKTCAAFFFLGAAFALAQETRGNISGTVADPQGGVIAGASVTVTSLDTKVTTPIKTNNNGYYLASLLIPGRYEVTVESPGFKRSVRSGLILGVGQQMDLDITPETPPRQIAWPLNRSWRLDSARV